MITPREFEVVKRISAAYGLAPIRIYSPQSGYRNRSYRLELSDGRSANLITYKTEPGILPRIHRANRVSNALAGLGLPARTTLDPRIIRLRPSPAKYAALYHYLPGATIPWEAYTMEHIKVLGATMAQMHAALKSVPATNLPHVTDDYLAFLSRMRTYFADPAVSAGITQKLGLNPTFQLMRYDRLLKACAQLPQRQPLHLDFVRGNILFSPEANITGILDFEKTALGHPVFDLARTLAFLLVDCKYKTGAQIHKYFLHSGYHKWGEGGLPPINLLEELVNLFLIYDFYKFLRHNPYEFLPQNEHFVRTRDLLEQKGLLQSITPRILTPVPTPPG